MHFSHDLGDVEADRKLTTGRLNTWPIGGMEAGGEDVWARLSSVEADRERVRACPQWARRSTTIGLSPDDTDLATRDCT